MRGALVACLVGAVVAVAWSAGLYRLGHDHGAAKVTAARDAQDRRAEQAAASDRALQHQFMETLASQHARELAALNRNDGAARARISSLPGRACLDAGTVGVLNATGTSGADPVRAPALDPAGAPAAVATDRDVAEHIATCRTRYGEIASQLSAILDIEDRRHPPADPAP